MADPGPRWLLPFDTFRRPHHLTDVLVIGTGVAGYSAALAAAQKGVRVLCVAKGDLDASNTGWAQGGVAAVVDGREDSIASHVRDTLEVGQGLCDRDLVEGVVREAAARVADLQALGARFDGEPGHPNLALEGGHSEPRVLHARGDGSGAEIRDALRRAVEASPAVDLRPKTFLVDLLTDESGTSRGALAPRDVVSRAILRQLAKPDVQGVFLDLTHLGERVLKRFPGIAAACRAHGLDLTRDRIPVRPAAHYTIGGVATDAQARTSV